MPHKKIPFGKKVVIVGKVNKYYDVGIQKRRKEQKQKMAKITPNATQYNIINCKKKQNAIPL